MQPVGAPSYNRVAARSPAQGAGRAANDQFTVNAYCSVCVTPPPMALIVTGYVPAGVPVLAPELLPDELYRTSRCWIRCRSSCRCPMYRMSHRRTHSSALH